MKLDPKLRRTLGTVFTALILCGSTYWVSRLYFRIPGEFGNSPSGIERFFGPAHVILGFILSFVIGRIWSEHIAQSIKANQWRISGFVFLAFVCCSIVSGIGMLYLNEELIHMLETIHPWIALSMTPILIFHVISKKRAR